MNIGRSMFSLKKKILLLWLALAFFFLAGCGVNRQVREMKNFGKSKFRLVSIDSTTLAGVNMRNVNSASDISFTDKARIIAAYSAGSLPLYTKLNLEVRNTTSRPASMNEFDWIMLLDGEEVARGTSPEQVKLPADSNAAVSFSFPVNTDVRKLASKGPRGAIANLALGLVDLSRNPARLSLKIKPTIMLGSKPVKYPNYIIVSKDFNTSNNTIQ